jgi:hypothetical protein
MSENRSSRWTGTWHGRIVARGLPFGVGTVAFGIIMGVGMYVMGTMVAAMWEGLLALSDIATNTKRVP